jgi:aminoglycoside 3-N-acetyltransferase
MIAQSLQDYLRPTYHALRAHAKRLDRALDRRTLNVSEFEDVLRQLGITAGKVVMVHSSMDAISRRVPGLTPVGLIQMLQRLLTADGTVLMPTFPFVGRQLHYVQRTSSFDVQRTPSQSGLITEVFRRMPGVLRSLHPTHPVAGWGKAAKPLLAMHHCGGAFGWTSPLYKIREHEGFVVGLGTRVRTSFTILHVPEQVHPKAREHFFESEQRRMTVVDGATRIEYAFRSLRADVYRNYGRVEKILTEEGILRCISSAGLQCPVMHANAFLDRAMRLIDEGQYL